MLENTNDLNNSENQTGEEQGSFFSEKKSDNNIESVINNNTQSNNAEQVDRQKIFSGNGDISGLKSSVLKEQSAKEKDDIEKALKKQAQKNNKSDQHAKKLPLKQILAVILVLILLVIGYKNIGNFKKLLSFIPKTQPAVAILEQDTFVYANDFRLKIKTSSSTDKTTLQIISNNQVIQQINGKIISTDKDGSLYWELPTTGLKKGDYSYKCYAKNTKQADSLTIVKGVFAIK